MSPQQCEESEPQIFGHLIVIMHIMLDMARALIEVNFNGIINEATLFLSTVLKSINFTFIN